MKDEQINNLASDLAGGWVFFFKKNEKIFLFPSTSYACVLHTASQIKSEDLFISFYNNTVPVMHTASQIKNAKICLFPSTSLPHVPYKTPSK